MFWQKKGDLARDHLKELLSERVQKAPLAFAFAGETLVEHIFVDFIFLIIDEPELNRFKVLCAEAIQIAEDFDVDLTANAGGLLQIAVGPTAELADCTERRVNLTSSLAAALGKSARIVHGCAPSRVGVVGTKSRKTAGFYPNAITQILQALVASSPGTPVNLGKL